MALAPLNLKQPTNPPLEKTVLQSRESDTDAEMSSSNLSEEDALEYNMSEDSPAVISPPPSSKPEKSNKYKNSFSWTANYPHVLAVRGIPLDGWYISVPGVSIGWYASHLAGLLKGIKRRGHSLGLVLRVVTVPGGDPQRIGSD
ncbi:hypothetical protein AVEN_89515-1 [Araneus ventricosus]|uniref:Uncharacterized protein n=1 Tax=Araneus ventricosus TaxID=182803 RepID=A0A4Y2KJM4_ARAVE|nr:hypothetical protein AVEN_89515-1 [Araneus ventricosus]